MDVEKVVSDVVITETCGPDITTRHRLLMEAEAERSEERQE